MAFVSLDRSSILDYVRTIPGKIYAGDIADLKTSFQIAFLSKNQNLIRTTAITVVLTWQLHFAGMEDTLPFPPIGVEGGPR